MTRFELIGLPYYTTLTIKNGNIKAVEMPADEIDVDDKTEPIKRKFNEGEKFKFIKMNIKLNFVWGEVENGKVYKFKLRKLLKHI